MKRSEIQVGAIIKQKSHGQKTTRIEFIKPDELGNMRVWIALDMDDPQYTMLWTIKDVMKDWELVK